jgi:hypothetical protein
MSFLRTLYADLRERQILPAVILLAVLAVAIPIAASKLLSSYTAAAVPTLPPLQVKLPKGVAPPAKELVALDTPPPVKSITRSGNEPNPFREGGAASTAASSSGTSPTQTTTPKTTTPKTTTPKTTAPRTTTTPKTTTPKTTATPKPSTSKQTTSPGSGSSGKTSTPTAKATPATGPATLKSDQAYTVNIDTKDATGTHALSNVVRLAPLPAAETPEVIYLGVLSGGKKAAFLFTNTVQVSSGPGSAITCLPSTSDCQIVELSPGQGLSLAPTSNTALISTFTFELMSIGAETFSNSGAAMQAREAVSTPGQALLPLSTSTVLSTLHFDANTGALVEHAPSGGGSGGSTGSSGSTGASGPTGASGSNGPSGGSTQGDAIPSGETFVASPLR